MTQNNETGQPLLSADYVRSVWREISGNLRPTLLVTSEGFDAALGAHVLLACETYQHTGSFKFRAAFNLLRSVPQSVVVTASSGNFGQAAALASRQLGKACTVVMPSTSSRVKIEAVRRLGATVDLVDTVRISRMERVRQLLEAEPSSFYAPAFDDTRVVAGNSTLGREIFEPGSDLDLVVVAGSFPSSRPRETCLDQG
ncbi:MAG: pyridoxal-phosphate dependent enzyme [Chloroflexi bacterium]|nr:pyridoxal-phosphate dependent enzyme [Chloroflexota bacterium]